MSLTRPIPALLLLAAVLPAAEPTPAPTLEERVKALDQQVRLLQRKAEVAEEVAKAADDKAKAAIKPSDLTFKWKAVVQGRATVGASAATVAGDSHDYFTTPAAAVNGRDSEASRFALRRIRLNLEARSKEDTFALVTLRSDNVGTSGQTSTGGASAVLYQGFIGKTFKSGDLEHDLRFGLDQPYTNWSSISTSTDIFAGDRPVGTVIGNQREIGLGYQFRSPVFRGGFDIQDNSNLTRNATTSGASSGNYDRRPTPFTSFRIEGSPGAEYLPARKQHSYVGAYGTEVLVGFDYQNSGRTYAIADEVREFQILGPDVLAHWDNLTFLAEYRVSRLNRQDTRGSAITNSSSQESTLVGNHWNAQVAYTLPIDDLPFKIEPAFRFARTDWAANRDEKSSWGANGSRDNNVFNPNNFLSSGTWTKAALESGTQNLGSGNQIDLGVNFYWSGHTNKTQVSFQRWVAENDDASAQAVIVQQQVTF